MQIPQLNQIKRDLQIRLGAKWTEAIDAVIAEWEELDANNNFNYATALIAARMILQNFPMIAAEFEDLITEMFGVSFNAGILDTELTIEPDEGDMQALDWLKNNRNGFIPSLKNMSQSGLRRIEEVLRQAYMNGGEFNLQKMTQAVRDATQIGKNRAELIVRTETAKISALGRIFAWGNDNYKDHYWYEWIATPDDRTKDVSLKFEREGPYSYDDIKKRWETDHNQPILVKNRHTGKEEYQVSAYNCRCSVARFPKDLHELLDEGKITQREYEDENEDI